MRRSPGVDSADVFRVARRGMIASTAAAGYWRYVGRTGRDHQSDELLGTAVAARRNRDPAPDWPLLGSRVVASGTARSHCSQRAARFDGPACAGATPLRDVRVASLKPRLVLARAHSSVTEPVVADCSGGRQRPAPCCVHHSARASLHPDSLPRGVLLGSFPARLLPRPSFAGRPTSTLRRTASPNLDFR